jgi:hypothetical protein
MLPTPKFLQENPEVIESSDRWRSRDASPKSMPPNSLATSSHVGRVMDLYLKFVTAWYTQEFADHVASHENRQHNAEHF